MNKFEINGIFEELNTAEANNLHLNLEILISTKYF